jgi:hypothetical protein
MFIVPQISMPCARPMVRMAGTTVRFPEVEEKVYRVRGISCKWFPRFGVAMEKVHPGKDGSDEKCEFETGTPGRPAE